MPDQRIRAVIRERDPASLFARAGEVLGELGAA